MQEAMSDEMVARVIYDALRLAARSAFFGEFTVEPDDDGEQPCVTIDGSFDLIRAAQDLKRALAI